MDGIIPEGAAMGAQAVVEGAVQPEAVKLDEDDATTLVVPSSLPAINRDLHGYTLGYCRAYPYPYPGETHTHERVWVSAVGYEKWTRGTTHGGSYPRVSCV